MSQDGTIIVGVDGSSSSRSAVEWAVRRAERLRCQLHMVHVIPDELLPPGHKRHEEVYEIIGELLEREASGARGLAPTVAVTTRLAQGEPAAVLASMSASASMVVVGTDRTPDVHGEAFGVVNIQIATITQCAVAVIPVKYHTGNGSVVVGVDGTPAADVAAQFAAGEAETRGLELTVLHAQKPIPQWLRGSALQGTMTTDVRQGRHRILDDAVERVRRNHQHLTINVRFDEGTDPAHALVQAGKEAGLLVLGSRGPAAVHHLLMGSVLQDVLLNLSCPLILTRPHAVAEDPEQPVGSTM